LGENKNARRALDCEGTVAGDEADEGVGTTGSGHFGDWALVFGSSHNVTFTILLASAGVISYA